ncbi:hypothetical protein [Rossellomorea sp. SC111]|nr:hypothetical protein [Rossellomorea sp. SC111]
MKNENKIIIHQQVSLRQYKSDNIKKLLSICHVPDTEHDKPFQKDSTN